MARAVNAYARVRVVGVVIHFVIMYDSLVVPSITADAFFPFLFSVYTQSIYRVYRVYKYITHKRILYACVYIFACDRSGACCMRYLGKTSFNAFAQYIRRTVQKTRRILCLKMAAQMHVSKTAVEQRQSATARLLFIELPYETFRDS